MGDGIALYCMLYPESTEKQQRCLDLLRHNAREYYTQPTAKCTTWSYFTPFKPSPSNPVIGGLEIYTEKSALQKQVDDPVYFQSYHQTVKDQSLYSKPEELTACYFDAGFVEREGGAGGKRGDGVLISVSRMQCKSQAEVLGLLRSFAPWVEANEPGVLTYASFIRPKAPKEVVLFVRYADGKAMKAHNVAPEHQDVVKKLSKVLEGDLGKATTLWREVPDSFASNSIGGGSSRTSQPKL